MTAADHTPSPATDGLREAIEALVHPFSPRSSTAGSPYFAGYWDALAEVRAALAAHPAPPSETATECEDGVFGSQDIADALGGRGPRSAPPVSSDEDRADEGVRLWSCPDCAFTFDAVHTDQDGGHSCPMCAETALAARLAEVEQKWRALAEQVASAQALLPDECWEETCIPCQIRAALDATDTPTDGTLSDSVPDSVADSDTPIDGSQQRPSSCGCPSGFGGSLKFHRHPCSRAGEVEESQP